MKNSARAPILLLTKLRKALKRHESVMEIILPSNPTSSDPVSARGKFEHEDFLQSAQYHRLDPVWASCSETGQSTEDINNEKTRDSVTHKHSISVENPTDDMHFPVPSPVRPRAPTPYSMPVFNQLSVETVTIHPDRRTSKDTTMVTPSPIQQIIRDFIPWHPAISNNPPPFMRHSEPVRQNGTDGSSKDSRLHLQQQLSLKDDECERLADQLDATIQELEDVKCELDLTREELIVRQQVFCEEFHNRMRHMRQVQDRYDSTAHRLKELKEEHAGCFERSRKHTLQAESLAKSRFKTRGQLRRKVIDLELQDAERECDLQNAKREERRYAEASLEAECGRASTQEALKDSIQRLEAALKQLDVQQQQLEDVKQVLAERDTDNEDLRLAQGEVFQLHKRLRESENEAEKLRRALQDQKSTVVSMKQFSDELGLENTSLKHRLAEGKRSRNTA